PPQFELPLVIREISSQADYAYISCFMMETTSVCRDLSTSEHAKKGDIIAVFEVEDDEDFEEERGSR
ncbi:hypothetical protein KI387_012754, partial [Taxus chinensis]